MVEKVYFILTFLLVFYSKVLPQWQSLGLENDALTKIIIDPNDSNTLFAGSRSDFSLGSVGALFKSTNFGSTWDTLLSVVTVRDLAIDPLNSEIIYIAAGGTAGNDPGVYKTTDGGTTWFNADSGISLDGETNVGTIRMDPHNEAVLYCGTYGFMGGNLYKTTNSGLSWFVPCADSFFNAGVDVIEFDRYDTGTIYTGRAWDGKLSRSSDGGINWEYAGYTNGGSIGALEFGSNSDEMYAASWWSINYPVGIFKTSNRGTDWINLGQEFIGIANVYDVKVNPTAPEYVYMGLDADYGQMGMYVKNGEQPWKFFGLSGIIVNSIAINNNLIYVATEVGVYFRDVTVNFINAEANLTGSTSFLSPAYPNPFNSETKITYELTNEYSNVKVQIIDILGNTIRLLIDGYGYRGKYELSWNGKNDKGSDVTTGLYFVRLLFGSKYEIQKILFLK